MPERVRIRRLRNAIWGFAAQQTGLLEISRGGWVETAYRSAKFLIGLRVADIIGPQLHFGLSDWLPWCRQQG